MRPVTPIPAFDVQPRRSVFLGWNFLDGYKRCWSEVEDSVGIVGPPRYGKTSGLIIPSVLWWDGPVVCTSTRADVLAFTGAHRQALAAPYGGAVLVYDPFGSVASAPSLRWSPLAGCRDPGVCYRRVAAMTAVAGQGLSEGEHWRAGAAAILRGCFHAAAITGRPLAEVRRWLARQEVREPVAILRTSDSTAAMWADDLEATRLLGDRERGSFYSVARNTLEAVADPTVLASCEATDLDIDAFLRSRSALFLVSPSHQQQVVAPLMAGLVDSIAQGAAELAAAAGGRLDPPLLLALDEIANIAPLHSLPALVSEGGGRGVVTLWAVQSLAQLRVRYGVEQQAAILAATTAKVVFGGLSNGQDLANISAWAGERQETSVSRHVGPSGATEESDNSDDHSLPSIPGRLGVAVSGDAQPPYGTVVGSIYRPALPVSQLQMMPPGFAWLFYRSDPPRQVEARPAGLIPEFQRLRSGPDGA